jgi:hypothetical protein
MGWSIGSAITLAALFLPAISQPTAQAQQASQPEIAKRIGAIKTINGNTLTLSQDSGPDITATVAPNARILRMSPGAKDLKDATPIQLQDLQVGDKVRVRGHASAGGIDTLEVLVITSSAVDAVRAQIRQDWQKRGVSGLVDSVDIATGSVTLSIPGLGSKRTVVIRTTKSTVVHRYSPDSSKPEDAKPGAVRDIHSGDQLRARGDRSADGNEVTAEEIFTGDFPQFTATVKSVDEKAGTLSVQNLTSKKTIEVKITAESQLHKIPAEVAQRLALRLKSAMPPGVPVPGANSTVKAAAADSSNTQGAGAGAQAGGQTPGSMRSKGAPDFQQMVARMPDSSLVDLHLQKGDAVYILATEGTESTAKTVVVLVSGVEPILQAAPTAGQAMMLTPWSLGGTPAGDVQ